MNIVSDLLNVTSSPHVREKENTQRIMLYVIISLLPASLFGIFNFGYRALILILVTIASCVASEWIFEKIVHKKSTVGDLSAVVTGLLLALNLPHTLPWWQAVLGGVFAIVVVKMLFGGLGQNFMNPALGARCFLLISFTSSMTSFTYDGVTGATPLALLKNGESVDVMSMLLGTEDDHFLALSECSCPCKNGCDGVCGSFFTLQMLIIMSLNGSVCSFILIISMRGYKYGSHHGKRAECRTDHITHNITVIVFACPDKSAF